MPHVHNGIGTWYYGKRRLHRIKGTCEFCHRPAELESYDTTLFFVVFFVPLFPLSHKRILNQCQYCRMHRAMRLREWDELKASQIAELLGKLEQNPEDRDAILHGLGLAMGYQDEELFNKLATTLADHRKDDAAIQAQLAAGYSYFSRYPEAEAAYRAALAVDNAPAYQRQLALVLLKQGRPEEAFPYLLPILENKETADAGYLFLLVEGLQAQGLHAQALELIDLRDEAFPQLAAQDAYKKQRKTSLRYRNSSKKIKSPLLAESRKVGYRKGGWLSSVPRLIGPILLLALALVYLASAFRLGLARKVYVVNGWGPPYTVAINGRLQRLAPGANPFDLPEGEVVVECREPGLKMEPVRCRIETNFLARPFADHVFVINPDRLAIILQETSTYSALPVPADPPPQVHAGADHYHFTGVDYEFIPFPQMIQVSQGSKVTKTRIGMTPFSSPEDRPVELAANLDLKQQQEYARRVLNLDPDNGPFLAWLVMSKPVPEALAYLEPNLSARPVRVECHGLYQDLIDRNHPERDLRPDYEKLVAETKRQPESLYLLARITDGPEAEGMLQEAAAGEKPLPRALQSLGWRCMAQGRFEDAVRWLESACHLAPANSLVRKEFGSALIAAGQFDRFLQEINRQPITSANQLSRLFDQLRAHASRGDKVRAQATILSVATSFPGPANNSVRQWAEQNMRLILCCGTKDVAGFLQVSSSMHGESSFEAALLRGEFAMAANLAAAETGDENETLAHHALCYLAASQAKDNKLAVQQWARVLAALDKMGRHERHFGAMLADRRPMTVAVVRSALIDPRLKRVLVAIAARSHPELEKELLPMAQQLNFHCDPVSLCLWKLKESR